MHIPKEFLENQAFFCSPLAFSRQIPVNANPILMADPNGSYIPEGAVTQEDGTVKVAFYGPEAETVTAFHEDVSVDLVKDEAGLWTGILPYYEPGFKQLGFKVNGVTVLNRMAPVGFGSNTPLNYVEVPDTECDFLLLKDVPHGSVTREYFKSTYTGRFISCLVYTPPGYQQDLSVNYPVLYLQHGGGENETSWVYQGKINFTMDNLIAEGKAVPCIIVMSNGMVQLDDGKGGTAVRAWEFENLLFQDVIPFIEKTYRVKPGKENRAIAGLSLGSLQCGKIILEHPDMFIAAGLFTGITSPFSDPSEQHHLKALDNAEYLNKEIKVLFRAIGDSESSYELIRNETKILEEKGVNNIEKVYPGEHEWRVWRRAACDFLQLIFK